MNIDLNTLLDTYSLGQLVFDAVSFLVVLFCVGLAMKKFVVYLWRKEKSFYDNLQRPIKIVTPVDEGGNKITKADMNTEKELLKKNKLLNLDDKAYRYDSLDSNSNHSIVVLGYNENMAHLDEIVDRVKRMQVPLIVYSFDDRVKKKDHLEKICGYEYSSFAQYKLTLLNRIFNTLASFPYEQKYN